MSVGVKTPEALEFVEVYSSLGLVEYRDKTAEIFESELNDVKPIQERLDKEGLKSDVVIAPAVGKLSVKELLMLYEAAPLGGYQSEREADIWPTVLESNTSDSFNGIQIREFQAKVVPLGAENPFGEEGLYLTHKSLNEQSSAIFKPELKDKIMGSSEDNLYSLSLPSYIILNAARLQRGEKPMDADQTMTRFPFLDGPEVDGTQTAPRAYTRGNKFYLSGSHGADHSIGVRVEITASN